MAFFLSTYLYSLLLSSNMGILYIVPTPVGNLDDMTFRAIKVLREVDFILAEDTRTSAVLLRHFDIHTPMYAHHKYNEHASVAGVISRLSAGESAALISDAGTPGISDPGFLLARESAVAGITVTCLPGPTACIPALVGSGMECDRFVFEGFLPQKKGRQTAISKLAEEERTIILYESPFRLAKTLSQLGEALGEDRAVCVCRELSKIYEEYHRSTLAEAALHYTENPPKGEIVIIVQGAGRKKKNKHTIENSSKNQNLS